MLSPIGPAPLSIGWVPGDEEAGGVAAYSDGGVDTPALGAGASVDAVAAPESAAEVCAPGAVLVGPLKWTGSLPLIMSGVST